MASPCSFQGADTDGEKICKAFGEKFSTVRLDGLKNFRQNPQGAKRPCIFLGALSVASHPEPGKVKPTTRHKKKVNVMKKRIEIRQDWKRGFGSAPTGIKNRVKWSLVGFVVYVAVRFVCASLGGMLSMSAVLAVVFFLIRAVWRILCVLALFILVLCVIL